MSVNPPCFCSELYSPAEFLEGTSFTRELTQETSGSSTLGLTPFVAAAAAALPLRNPKDADFLSLLRSSPLKPQSNFPSGELQSETFEAIKVGEFAKALTPARWLAAPRSIKLWLRFAKAADLEFMTAAATAAEESKPNVDDFLAGDEETLDG